MNTPSKPSINFSIRIFIAILIGMAALLTLAAIRDYQTQQTFGQIAFITAITLLLLSWLIILRVSRQIHESLMESNMQLAKRSRELDDLNRTLEEKVQERSRSLQVLQSQLLQSEKFSAIGQLAAGIAHEINNPIGFINSNLQTLARYAQHYSQLLGVLNKLEKALRDKDQERIAQIVHSWEEIKAQTNFAFIDDDIGHLLQECSDGTEKIRKIVFDLRTFASPDKGMVDAVDLQALLESMLNITWNEIKYKAQVVKDYAPIPAITCDVQKISQVFVNLLLNAAQAIEKKGFITVKTYCKEAFVCVDITDTGCGISPEHTRRIFDPFFTTKPAGKGTGLGLSLSYDIVRRHGGTISFVSKVGEGTTFTVMLPASFAYDSAQL